MFIVCIATVILSPILLGLKPTYNEISASADSEKTFRFPKSTLPLNGSSPHGPLTVITTPTMQRWTSIAVCPQTINLTASDSFTININVINVTNLMGYDFELGYNNSIVTATEVNVGDFFPKDSFVIKREIDSTNGIVWVAVLTPIGSHLKVSGSGTLATVRFKAISTGSCVLKLYNIERASLITDDGKYPRDIAHNVIDGYVQCKIYEHEIAAYLNAPVHLQPGSSWLINGSAVNKGLCNETDVSFQLLIDGEVVNSTIARLLTARSSIGLTYMFMPTEERIYNITAYVKPLPNEEHTQNNAASANVIVRTHIRVPQDYATIQEAIDAAVSGETIIVASGVYHEHIGIDKPLALVGESCNTTIIDGDGETRVIVVIKASRVRIGGFTIRNGAGGILLEYSNNSVIAGNIILNTMDGLSLLFSHNNTIISNTIKDNETGLFLGYSNSNIIYYNNFISNTEQAVTTDSQNTWDNGVEGNYWSDYKGEDPNGDGVGDTPYVIDKDNEDNYPLVKQRHVREH